jgi:hypothetical protein
MEQEAGLDGTLKKNVVRIARGQAREMEALIAVYDAS